MAEEFPGFSLPNAIPVPEELWGLLPELGGAELKVLLLLFRKTLGFQKREDAVALSQITAGTGLSRPAVVAAVRRLEERGCLEIRQAWTPEGDRDTNVYAPRFRTEGEGVVKKVNHPLKESYMGVVKKLNQHDISAAATAENDSDFFRFLKNFFGRELTAEEIAQIRALEAEGIPEETIREGMTEAFRTWRRTAANSPTLKDCIRIIRRRHRKHPPAGDAETLPATGCAPAPQEAPNGLAQGDAETLPATGCAPAPQEAPNGLTAPAAADPLSPPDDALREVWTALAECGCATPPIRRGIRLLADKHPPEQIYCAVVEALAYGVPAERLLGYVRRVLERRAAEVVDAGEEEVETTDDAKGQGPPSDQVDDDTPEGIWKRALRLLELELTRATFNSWLAPSRCIGREGNVLVVELASPQARDWLERRLRERIEQVVARVAGRPLVVRFVVEGEVEQ